MKRLCVLLLALMLALVCVPVFAEEANAAGEAMRFDKERFTMQRGKSLTLKVTFLDGALSRKIKWKTSDSKVVTVSPRGVVKAVGAGEATITVVNSAGQSASTRARVVVPVSSVRLNVTQATLQVGRTMLAKAKVYPIDATNKVLAWTSSNPAVASVSEDGTITAKAVGAATIRATAAGGKYAALSLRVSEKADALRLNYARLDLARGQSATLKAKVSPSGARASVRWSSADTRVATVSAGGKVTARRLGETTILARTADGLTASCVVRVLQPVTGLSVKPASLTLAVGGGDASLSCAVAPADASDKSLEWTSSNASVATVNADGVVRPVAVGKATITARAHNGKTATASVRVVVPATAIKLDKSELSLKAGAGATLSAAVSPSGATDKSVSWSSSKASVASVSADGRVTARGAGSCVIRATANGGLNLYAECRVTVTGTASKVIALTFDDGPCSTTLDILKTLKKYDAKATFFMLGSCVKAHPEIAKAVSEGGHEIGSHSYSHKNLTQMSVANAKKEIERTEQLIYNATGKRPAIARAPGGSINNSLAKKIGRVFVNWNVDPLDWKYRDATRVYNAVVKGAGDRRIVLMHDIRPTTADALKRILPKLIEKGYTFVTVSELMEITGRDPDNWVYRP